MDFQQAEQYFARLEALYREGQIDPSRYRDELARLSVTDASGLVWQMQEHTGQWYVFNQGQWVAATPPGRQPRVTPLQVPVQGKSSSQLSWLLSGGAVLVLCGICVAALVAGYWLFGQKNTSAQKSGAEAINLKTVESVVVAADDQPYTDQRGVSLQVPSDALEEGVQAQMTAYEVSGAFLKAVRQAYTVEGPLYGLSVQGQDDSTGWATLTFPADDPQARLMVVIDQAYVGILDVEPTDGVLQVDVLLGPSDTSGFERVGSLEPGGEIFYAVVTPKNASVPNPVAAAMPAVSRMMRMAAQGDAALDCGQVFDESGIITTCRKNPAGSVHVYFDSIINLSNQEADQVVRAVDDGMQSYARLGFTGAVLSPGSPMHVVVIAGAGDPYYRVINGTIYIPIDTARNIAAGQQSFELLHEMAHRIQDQSYNMTWAYWGGGGKIWWIEPAAEAMVMLVQPAYIATNLSYYGKIINSDKSMVFQSSPYQWPTDFYVQAQLIMVNMCNDPAVCPLSQVEFVDAISRGLYPFDSGAAQRKLSDNLDDYARYLLGVAPLKANTSISLAGVQSAAGYGQYVKVWQTKSNDFTLDNNGDDPQMKLETQGATQEVVIRAPLQKDGVYPLQVYSGEQGQYVGLPAALVVQPGAPFYYRIDGGEVKYHDGSAELTIAPIHSTMGISNLRLVALGKNGGEVFEARVKILDLQGVWLVGPGKLFSNTIACTLDGEASEDDLETDYYVMIVDIGSVMGNFTPGSDGKSLAWSLVDSRLPAGVTPGDLNFVGSVQLTTQDIQVRGSTFIPQQVETGAIPSPVGAAVSTAAVLLFPVAWLGSKWQRKRLPRWVLVFLASLLLAGCVGVEMFGSVEGTMAFTKIEYMGGQDPVLISNDNQSVNTPLWRLSGGSGTFLVEFNTLAVVGNADGTTNEALQHCTGTLEYELIAVVYKDAVVTLQIP